jgi:hypothetical protein
MNHSGVPTPWRQAEGNLRDFFGTLDHGWLVKFIEHRVADRRVVRLIQKWLRAGVLEERRRTRSSVGTVQGGSISPLLANVYLHFVFDLWLQRWRRKQAQGEVILVRFADDFVVGFEHRREAERFLAELRERFAQFGMALHPDKTRLIEFGRFADRNRRGRGDGKPETFDSLGFTHACGKTRRGKFAVLRQTMRKRWQAKLREVRTELRRRLHDPLPEQGAYLRSVLLGHNRYYGVPRKARAWARSKTRSPASGVPRSRGAARPGSCRGNAWRATSADGFPRHASAIPTPTSAWRSSPEASGNAARPDLWRG